MDEANLLDVGDTISGEEPANQMECEHKIELSLLRCRDFRIMEWRKQSKLGISFLFLTRGL